MRCCFTWCVYLSVIYSLKHAFMVRSLLAAALPVSSAARLFVTVVHYQHEVSAGKG